MAMMYRFKACQRCGGDLMLDDGAWLCCQCGRHYYPKSMLVGTQGHPPAAGGLGRHYEELPGAAGAGRVAVPAPAGAAGPRRNH